MKIPSLPDWAFLPLSALTIAGMIYGALQFGSNNLRSFEEIRTEGVLIEGDMLQGMVTGPGLAATFLDDRGTTIARVTAVRGPLDGTQSAGAFFALSPNELAALQGHSLSVRMTVRSAATDGADRIRATVFVPGMSQSDWQEYPVSSNFEEVSFILIPPSCIWDYGYAGMWPDWQSGANTIEVARVSIEVHEAQDCD